jgi:RNA polymerase sigma-70 factor, ECF subfamily
MREYGPAVPVLPLYALAANRGESKVSVRPDFAEFYAASFGRLTVQLHAFTGDHAEAQDLVQEALCRAYSKWETISSYDDPLGWVRRVAWNLAVSRWRRANVLKLWRRDLVPPDVPPPSEQHVELVRALTRLNPRHRQAVVLHYLADMTIGDIAQFCDVAEGTVKAWLHRGRAELSAIMTPRVEAHDA